MQICKRSDEILDRLAENLYCSRRDAIEGLILGTIPAQTLLAARERLSEDELTIYQGIKDECAAGFL